MIICELYPEKPAKQSLSQKGKIQQRRPRNLKPDKDGQGWNNAPLPKLQQLVFSAPRSI